MARAYELAILKPRLNNPVISPCEACAQVLRSIEYLKVTVMIDFVGIAAVPAAILSDNLTLTESTAGFRIMIAMRSLTDLTDCAALSITSISSKEAYV